MYSLKITIHSATVRSGTMACQKVEMNGMRIANPQPLHRHTLTDYSVDIQFPIKHPDVQRWELWLYCWNRTHLSPADDRPTNLYTTAENNMYPHPK